MNLYLSQFLAYSSEIVPVIASLAYSSRLPRTIIFFSWYLILSLSVSILSAYLSLHRIHNLWISNVFIPIQFTMLAYFFSLHLSNIWKQIARLSIPAFILFVSIDFAFFESVSALTPYAKSIDYTLLTFVAALSLSAMYRQNLTQITSEPLFWIASAMIIYCASSAVLFSLSSTFLKISIETLKLAISLQAIIFVVSNLLLTGAFFCLRRR